MECVCLVEYRVPVGEEQSSVRAFLPTGRDVTVLGTSSQSSLMPV